MTATGRSASVLRPDVLRRIVRRIARNTPASLHSRRPCGHAFYIKWTTRRGFVILNTPYDRAGTYWITSHWLELNRPVRAQDKGNLELACIGL